MVTLEQVKLLETKVTKTIEHVKKVTEENSFLKGKLDTYQQRIDELEVLVKRFKEDQNRIEDGILSALDRLNQFEDALESSLSKESSLVKEAALSPDVKPDAKKKAEDKAQPGSVLEEEEPEEISAEDESPENELDIF